MPRDLVRATGASRKRTLGWLAVWWIESFLVHGPGDVEGEPIVHTDEYTGFVLDCYILDKKGRRMHDSAFLSRPKGCNKSGLAAEIALFEALGPCRFAGWAKGGETYEFLGKVYTYEKGEPMGKSPRNPVVRLMATEEDQTGNVYDVMKFNLEYGVLAQLKAYGLLVTNTKVTLPFGGEILPSTTGAASKDGGKETFVVFDESHLYNTKTLHQMYDTVTRNLVKRRHGAGTWSLETTTMYAPGEDSVAELTFEYAKMIQESQEAEARGERGSVKRSKLLYDHRWGEIEDLSDEEALIQAVEEAYGECLTSLGGWVGLEAVIDDIFDPRRTEAQSRRYFLNSITGENLAWIQPAQLASVKVPVWEIPDGEEITLGFDGALTRDATVLMGCTVKTGELFLIKMQERPDGPEAEGWEVDTVAFDAAVKKAFKTWKVRGFFADPPFWQDYIDNWESEFGEGLGVKATQTSAIKFWTKRDNQMSLALERLHTAICSEVKGVRIQEHRAVMRHILNARVWERPGGNVIGKESKKSPKKIDAAMAATLAYEARAAYLHHGTKPKATFVPRRLDKANA